MKLKTIQVFMNDNKLDTMEFRELVITDMYGLDFHGGNAIESMVILASRLSGWEKERVESIQYASLVNVMNMVGELAAQATRTLGVVK